MYTAKFNSNFQSYLFTKYCGFPTVGLVEDNIYFETIESNLSKDKINELNELEVFIKIESIRCEGDYNMVTEAYKVIEITDITPEEYIELNKRYKVLLNKYSKISNEIQVKVLEEVKQMLKR